MKKETFSDKMIKRFYGITGPLDEQKRQQAEHLGNIGFISNHANTILNRANNPLT
ncbi:DUF3278 domain-containing protein [Streptococcus sanguinis]|uniref:Uncharacterized protein n=1 Tax=Streptococcus sanguinis TaxID=1305 RepID=A0A0B7GSL0_STRSA|nr:conserved protein of unknown function [Streptococcus sanguinis]